MSNQSPTEEAISHEEALTLADNVAVSHFIAPFGGGPETSKAIAYTLELAAKYPEYAERMRAAVRRQFATLGAEDAHGAIDTDLSEFVEHWKEHEERADEDAPRNKANYEKAVNRAMEAKAMLELFADAVNSGNIIVGSPEQFGPSDSLVERQGGVAAKGRLPN